MKADVTAVKKIAREAGGRILKYCVPNVDVHRKADDSPVTAADREANGYIVEALRRLTPDVPVIAEESRIPDYSERKDWTRFWLVDPLDGTKEFIKGLDEFTVNIALIENGSPVLGVIYAPKKRLMYSGSRDGGSWREIGDEAAIRIHTREPRLPYAIVESRSHGSEGQEAFLRQLPVADRVRAGSSLKFCVLAEGNADLYPRFAPTMEWDVAAGDAVYRYASPESPHPSPLVYNKPDLRNGFFVMGEPARPAVPSGVIWLTGLSGAGKTTLARAIRDQFNRWGMPVEHLDGDELRARLPSTGFTRPERIAHIARAGELAAKLEAEGKWVVVSLISPYEEARKKARTACRRFTEVHVATPMEVCEARDPKGLYRRARGGEIKNFTGIDDPYEPPSSPEIRLDASVPLEGAVILVLGAAGAKEER